MKLTNNSIQADIINRLRSGEKVKDIAALHQMSMPTLYKFRSIHFEAINTAEAQGKGLRPILTFSREHISFLQKTVPHKSPKELGLKQSPEQSGWTEYEVKELMKQKFDITFTLKVCLEQLMKLDINIGKHSKHNSVSVSERMLRQPSDLFTKWFITNGKAQNKRESKVLEKFKEQASNIQPVVNRRSKFFMESWLVAYNNLILTDPLSRDPQGLSQAVLKLIK
jgi:hypothetical protein